MPSSIDTSKSLAKQMLRSRQHVFAKKKRKRLVSLRTLNGPRKTLHS